MWRIRKSPHEYWTVHQSFELLVKIVTGEKSALVSAVYREGLRSIDDSCKYSWCRSVRIMLFQFGFGDAWYNQGVGNVDVFCKCFRQRVYDIYKQGWIGRLCDSTRVDFYRIYKDNFSFSVYLDIVDVKAHRIALTRLIMSSHSLWIESGRWERPVIPRNNRLCTNCHKLDDEYHLLLECTLLQDLRNRFIPKYCWYRPSMIKCLELLKCKRRKVTRNLAKCVYIGFTLKTSHV